MRYLFHETRAVLVSSATAGALMRYFTSLTSAWCADDVEVPAIDVDGHIILERMSVGPANRIRSVHAADDALESDDASFVVELDRRTHALHTS
ncbi:hypothetical protein [Curtobacterium sp. AB7]|uniref:hypothetical protein n=1 Tax=Curtobacterium sp. AB7 TaxID=3349327 RepID=UPI0038372995